MGKILPHSRSLTNCMRNAFRFVVSLLEQADPVRRLPARRQRVTAGGFAPPVPHCYSWAFIILPGHGSMVNFGHVSLTNFTCFEQKAVLAGEGKQPKGGIAVI